MSFKISRRTKQVLASLLITANFANLSNSNVKSMESISTSTSAQHNNYSDSVCITPELFKDILEVYEKHKNGKINIIEESNKLFDKINKNYFNSQLIHSFNDTHFNSNNKLISFAPYVLGRALEAFLDKNQGFKAAIKFCHEKIDNLAVLVYGFDSVKDDGKQVYVKFKEVFESHGMEPGNYLSSDIYEKYSNIRFSNTHLGHSGLANRMLALGITNTLKLYSDTVDPNSLGLNCLSRKLYYLDENFIQRILRKLQKETKSTSEKNIPEKEIITTMIYNSLHEIAHHLSAYLELLEKLNGLLRTTYPIKINTAVDSVTDNWISALKSGSNNYFMSYVSKMLNLNEKEEKVLVDYIISCKPKNIRVPANSLGHTYYGIINILEDFAESFALGSMTNEFPALTILIKKWNERAQKLVNSYNESEHKARELKYFESLRNSSKK